MEIIQNNKDYVNVLFKKYLWNVSINIIIVVR